MSEYNLSAVKHGGFISTAEYAAESAHILSIMEEAYAMNLGFEVKETLDLFMFGTISSEEFLSELYDLISEKYDKNEGFS